MAVNLLGILFFLLSFDIFAVIQPSQYQDIYFNVSVDPIEKIEIQSQAYQFKLNQKNQFGEPIEQLFAYYSYSLSKPNYKLKASLNQALPEDVRLFLKAEAPAGATSNQWVEIGLVPQPLVEKIPIGINKDLKIEIKIEQNEIAGSFNPQAMQIQYIFDDH